MCVRNLSERVVFSESDELLRSLNYGIKIDKYVIKAILFTKTWNIMVQKGVFFTVCHSKRSIRHFRFMMTQDFRTYPTNSE